MAAEGPERTPSASTATPSRYSPITRNERLEWVIKGTIGPKSLGTGIFLAAIATAQNRPREYGPHWDGLGKRYGMRLVGVATGRSMEASLGSLWGENPRYLRSEGHALKSRFRHIVVSTFSAPREDGHYTPAYARLIAVPGSNFLSNTWRPDSTATTADAGKRIALAFVGRMAGNVFAEFWPDLKKRVFKRKGSQSATGVNGDSHG